MLLQPKEAARQPSTVLLLSGRKPTKIEGLDWYLNTHSLFSTHFDNKELTGFDKYVQGTVYTYTHVALNLLKDLIIEASKDERFVESGLVIMLSCSIGERCSIAFVELLGKILFEQTTLNVRVVHTMEQKWFKF